MQANQLLLATRLRGGEERWSGGGGQLQEAAEEGEEEEEEEERGDPPFSEVTRVVPWMQRSLWRFLSRIEEEHLTFKGEMSSDIFFGYLIGPRPFRLT